MSGHGGPGYKLQKGPPIFVGRASLPVLFGDRLTRPLGGLCPPSPLCLGTVRGTNQRHMMLVSMGAVRLFS
jgi:hypothetical protein